MLLIIGVVVMCLVLAAVVLPGKSAGTSAAKAPSPLEMLTGHTLSLRQQQLSEEASVISEEYRARADERWRAEVRQAAAQMLSDPATEAATATPAAAKIKS
jgi:hypothetical protein